jgi:N-acetylglutamate synthase-like GNAT family acetyltransferase
MGTIRRCEPADFAAILAIVNDAAQAYRGHIPADRWHEPYMPADELERELAAGLAFWGYEEAGALAGVMGLQDVRDVALIRHAYVATAVRGRGIGGALLAHIIAGATRPMLVGTWAAATWAIRFYERHGFQGVSPAEKDRLLRAYWAIPDRQIETSVVLADARWRRLRLSPDNRQPQEDPS